MTNAEINRKMAEVMGWYKDGEWWKQKAGVQTIYRYEIEYWNPAERIEQAMMVLEKISRRQVVIENKYDRWTCGIQDKTGKWFDVEPNESLPIVICLAVIEARKFNDPH